MMNRESDHISMTVGPDLWPRELF